MVINLKLSRWNRNNPRIERPSIMEILDYGQPTLGLFPKQVGKKREEISFLVNWNTPEWFNAWEGIRIFNPEQELTYILSKKEYSAGKKSFDIHQGYVGEWSLDKYNSGANKYLVDLGCSEELLKEFEKVLSR